MTPKYEKFKSGFLKSENFIASYKWKLLIKLSHWENHWPTQNVYVNHHPSPIEILESLHHCTLGTMTPQLD
jgi:hypothetical protein